MHINAYQGTSFGYSDLIADPRNLVWLREAKGLVTMDVTHSLQVPGGRRDVHVHVHMHCAMCMHMYMLMTMDVTHSLQVPVAE